MKIWFKKERKKHWDNAHAGSEPTNLTWYQTRPDISLSQIDSAGVTTESRIIDVGGGISTLVDYLLKDGFENITVLDISSEALNNSKKRLGEKADKVVWLEEDILKADLHHEYDLWHDRAVFHFLTKRKDRSKYIISLKKSLKSDGQIVISTFSLNGPEMCCGLKVCRYSPELLQQELGECFKLIESTDETHVSPSGYKQEFIYCRFRLVK